MEGGQVVREEAKRERERERKKRARTGREDEITQYGDSPRSSRSLSTLLRGKEGWRSSSYSPYAIETPEPTKCVLVNEDPPGGPSKVKIELEEGECDEGPRIHVDSADLRTRRGRMSQNLDMERVRYNGHWAFDPEEEKNCAETKSDGVESRERD